MSRGTATYAGERYRVFTISDARGPARDIMLVPAFYPGATLRVDIRTPEDGRAVGTLTTDLDALTGRGDQCNVKAFVEEERMPWARPLLEGEGLATRTPLGRIHAEAHYRLYRFNLARLYDME